MNDADEHFERIIFAEQAFSKCAQDISEKGYDILVIAHGLMAILGRSVAIFNEMSSIPYEMEHIVECIEAARDDQKKIIDRKMSCNHPVYDNETVN